MMEIWKPVIGYKDIYEVSNFGRVKGIGGTTQRKVLKNLMGQRGYYSVTLSKNNTLIQYTIHRLVCAAFHGIPPSDKHEVAHYDGNKINNSPENLRWATRSENILDAIRHKTHPVGEKAQNSKLSNKQVIQIKELVKRGRISRRKIAQKFGVSYCHLNAIARGSQRKHG